ncbi:hypothetical protein [Nostoc punctiforme]|uniref:hypothetical protein n=1 Tax=Nostoc punctiforme TaxID=272131 RepID=UPI001F556F69|nr:hypothetical protein [Nostoc punctiforme]
MGKSDRMDWESGDRPPVHRIHTLQKFYQDEELQSIYRRIGRTNPKRMPIRIGTRSSRNRG